MRYLLTAILLGALTMEAQKPSTPAPSPSIKKDSKIYELRTYYATPGKLEDVHKRFRENTMRIFTKHGMKVVGFWGPIDKEQGSENKLIYILEFDSREAMTKAWAAFGKDPEWQAVAKASQLNGKLLEKVESIVMGETDYAKIH